MLTQRKDVRAYSQRGRPTGIVLVDDVVEMVPLLLYHLDRRDMPLALIVNKVEK